VLLTNDGALRGACSPSSRARRSTS
jgi:hypothetical protein